MSGMTRLSEKGDGEDGWVGRVRLSRATKVG